MGFLDIWYNSFVFVVFCSDWEALNPFIKKDFTSECRGSPRVNHSWASLYLINTREMRATSSFPSLIYSGECCFASQQYWMSGGFSAHAELLSLCFACSAHF